MCGIAAIFNYRTGQPVDRGEMGRVLTHMQRRGPDGSGEWYGLRDTVGLGHRRLSIIDLSNAGAQPMVSEDGRIVVTFNGEIYNYRELRAELESKGRRFHSHSDTEVLLHLYQLEGGDMVHKLRGMYAFVIWDEVNQSLFLARDPYGIKPLYYSDDGHTFRAASQVKALLAGGHIDTSPEPAGHVGYFLWGYLPAPFTLYQGIRTLPAGSSLRVDQSGSKEIKQFCSIPAILAEAEQSHPQPSTLNSQRGELLRSALQDTVRHHLIADVPVGVFLSSGLDSGTITALAAESSTCLRTVTLGFEEYRGSPNDEAPLAEQIAARYGATHQTIRVSKQDFRDNFSRVMQAMDQPSCDGVNSFFISHAAAQAGLKVALSGLGGDELFGGYPSFEEVPRAARLLQPFNRSTFQPFNRLFRVVSAPVLKKFTSPKYAGLLEYGGTCGGAFLLRRGLFMPWELPDLLDPDLARDGWAQLAMMSRLEETTNGIRSAYLRVAALEATWYMRGQLLRDTDWASMDHSLEVRTPLVDVELLRKLAPLLAGENPPSKQDMARSPLSALPSSILNRPKTGFSVPVRQWLVQEDSSFQRDRGLRGWTKLVYGTFLGHHFDPLGRARVAPGPGFKTASHKLSAKAHAPAVASRLAGGTAGHRIPAHHTYPPSGNAVVGSSRSPVVSPRRILVFRIGQLGDTIAALPALWAVKSHFPDAELTLLCDRHPGKAYVLGQELFEGSGFFKQFEFYPVREGQMGRLWQGRDLLQLLARLRKGRFDTLLYLAPSARSRRQVARDLRFFRIAGIKRFIGTGGFASAPSQAAGQPLDGVPHEAELLVARMAASGIPVLAPGQGCMDLRLGPIEEAEFRTWLERQKPEPTCNLRALTSGVSSDLSPIRGRPWVGFGPGSKMPAKKWSLERFREVGQHLIDRFDIWPVIFGGADDATAAATLLEAWGRGYSAAGHLSVRAAAFGLKHCLLHIGNDTGTMHLAAAVGTRCVAIFSARDRPGRWYPYGAGHRVLRTQIDCEGCGLVECVERKNECLRRISVAEVVAGCEAVLLSTRTEDKREEIEVRS